MVTALVSTNGCYSALTGATGRHGRWHRVVDGNEPYWKLTITNWRWLVLICNLRCHPMSHLLQCIGWRKIDSTICSPTYASSCGTVWSCTARPSTWATSSCRRRRSRPAWYSTRHVLMARVHVLAILRFTAHTCKQWYSRMVILDKGRSFNLCIYVYILYNIYI